MTIGIFGTNLSLFDSDQTLLQCVGCSESKHGRFLVVPIQSPHGQSIAICDDCLVLVAVEFLRAK